MGKRHSARSWRDAIPIHPAADLLPILSARELRELAKDIEANGLQHKVQTFVDLRTGVEQLIDGRNRLDAIELLGWPIIDDHGRLRREICRGGPTSAGRDPYDYVISVNLKRRHLTAEQKRELIAKLLKAKPERSNRQTAALTGVSHHTVATERAQLETTGQIAQLTNTIGADGRARPAKRTAKRVSAESEAAASEGLRNVTTNADLLARRIMRDIHRLNIADLHEPDAFGRELIAAAQRFLSRPRKERAQ